MSDAHKCGGPAVGRFLLAVHHSCARYSDGQGLRVLSIDGLVCLWALGQGIFRVRFPAQRPVFFRKGRLPCCLWLGPPAGLLLCCGLSRCLVFAWTCVSLRVRTLLSVRAVVRSVDGRLCRRRLPWCWWLRGICQSGAFLKLPSSALQDVMMHIYGRDSVSPAPGPWIMCCPIVGV